jgi:hypothetical protein
MFEEMDRRDQAREAKRSQKRYGKPHFWAGTAEAVIGLESVASEKEVGETR